MFARLNQTIMNAIRKVFDESVYDFSKWWQDDFETEYEFNSKDELMSYSEDDLQCIMYDWIAKVLDGLVALTLEELGIDEDSKTDIHIILIEEIHDIVKDELFKKIKEAL